MNTEIRDVVDGSIDVDKMWYIDQHRSWNLKLDDELLGFLVQRYVRKGLHVWTYLE